MSEPTQYSKIFESVAERFGGENVKDRAGDPYPQLWGVEEDHGKMEIRLPDEQAAEEAAEELEEAGLEVHSKPDQRCKEGLHPTVLVAVWCEGAEPLDTEDQE